MKKLFREPLVHFLFAGFLLFVYFRACSNPNIENELEDTILVDKEAILKYMQFQSKAFNKDVFTEKFTKFSDREKTQLVQNYVHDEVLYREAMKLGLDQNDFVIKRRIIQKMEFILDDFDETAVSISIDSLKDYYQQHQERYFQPEQFTFTHIFFKGTAAVALPRATTFMKKGQHQRLSAAESLPYGDRFLYHRNYAEKDRSFLESQFGNEFVTVLENLTAKPKQWQGPIASKYGQHWVLLMEKEKAGLIDFKSIQSVVKSDYMEDLKRRHKDEQIEKLKKEYDITIDL